ncbi:MAG: aminotransferase class V-fold PLP-dependent enzyme, partial [Nitrosopumilus sp.]
KKLRDILIENILNEIPKTTLNGHPKSRLPNNAHFTFLGVNGEDLIIKLDEYGIAASTGSACSVNTQKASHVLQAMGFSHEQITGSLRLTIGIFNDVKEIEQTVEILKKAVQELRLVSPFKEKYSFVSNN